MFTWNATELVGFLSKKFKQLFEDIQYIKDELDSIKEEIKKLKDKDEKII